MKVAFTSDLHIDLGPENDRAARRIAELVREMRPDVIVIAGDMGNTLETMESALALFSRTDAVRLFVAGNHDLWCEPRSSRLARGDSREKYEEAIPELCERMGFLDLGRSPCIVGDIGFVGSVGWYDYTLADPALGLSNDVYQEGRWGDIVSWDHGMIRWPRSSGGGGDELDDQAICAEMLHTLERHIAEVEHIVQHVVAVVHTCPFTDVVPADDAGTFHRAYVGSARLGAVLLSHEKVGACITGHRHTSEDWEISGLRVHRRALGAVGPGEPVESRARAAVGALDV